MNAMHYGQLVAYWTKLSDYDIKTAQALFQVKHFPYCLFFCHLSIEKILKALFVKITQTQAPFSHNLVELAKQTKISFSQEQKELFADLTEFNLEARYPEWKKKFYKKATKNYTELYLNKSHNLQKWLKKYLKK